MIDLNDAAAPAPAIRYDLDAIAARLRDTAHAWVPGLFPNGRRQGDEWRLANIQGAPPRQSGSCVIMLAGEHADGLATPPRMAIAHTLIRAWAEAG